jgi:hypothetical protein
MNTLERIASDMGNCIFRIETRNDMIVKRIGAGHQHFASELAKLTQEDLEKLKKLKTELLNLESYSNEFR